MYDSVYPSRTARFGVALVPSGVLKLKNVCYREDLRLTPAILVLMEHCVNETYTGISTPSDS